jgi:outer membrane biosynthesis protein TonB
MKHNILEVITGSILDICVHPLVENGIFDAQNVDHIFLLMENLSDKKFDDHIVSEVIKALRHEGKYPDRQAYNKEGWLVTFPSKEYRDAAIKKGTHSVSDPTHGKGGMNLYYRKKGKQKRVTQQATTQVGAADAETPSGDVKVKAQKQTPEAPASEKPSALPAATKPEPSAETEPSEPSDAGSKKQDDQPPTDQEPRTAEPLANTDKIKPSTATEPISPETGAEEPAIPADSAPAQEPVQVIQPNAEITLKFARNKGWTPTPYGEWRDSEGTVAAVVSLSGEVTPIKSNDRDELKIFSEKQG